MLGILNSCFHRDKMGEKTCDVIFYCNGKELTLNIQIL